MRRMTRHKISPHLAMLALIAVFILTGCMVGPDYKRPSVDVPQTWRFEDKEAKDVVNTLWWEQFNDPVLNDLILIALQESFSDNTGQPAPSSSLRSAPGPVRADSG
jgi:hypothetical protein